MGRPAPCQLPVFAWLASREGFLDNTDLDHEETMAMLEAV